MKHVLFVKCIITIISKAQQKKKRKKKGERIVPEGVHLSFVTQLDEDQEASMKRRIRVRFNMELVSVARSL